MTIIFKEESTLIQCLLDNKQVAHIAKDTGKLTLRLSGVISSMDLSAIYCKAEEIKEKLEQNTVCGPRKATEFIVVYFYAGAICADTSESVFNSLEEITLADWPNGAYAYKLYQQDSVTDTRTGKAYRGDRTEVDGKLHYHPDSKVETLEQVRNNPKATEILISNMGCNGWDSIVWTRYGNWPQPFDKETMCIG